MTEHWPCAEPQQLYYVVCMLMYRAFDLVLLHVLVACCLESGLNWTVTNYTKPDPAQAHGGSGLPELVANQPKPALSQKQARHAAAESQKLYTSCATCCCIHSMVSYTALPLLVELEADTALEWGAYDFAFKWSQAVLWHCILHVACNIQQA